MLRAKNHFDNSVIRVKEIHSLFKHLKDDLHFNSSFLDDLLRSEIVYIVSALDKFIHDIVRVGILESYNGLRPITNSLNNFTINFYQMNLIMDPLHLYNVSQILENIIIENHKHLSFQDPDKITYALSLIWNETHKWQKISQLMGMSENNLKIELKNIIIRRNQIVHEADLNLFSNSTQDILEEDVENSVNFISRLVDSIHILIN